MKIADTKLDYDLVFVVPIARLDDMEPPKDKNEIRRLFQLTMKRGNANIELTKEECDFFLSMTVELAVDFYNNPQTRDSQKGMVGQFLRCIDPIAESGALASIGMTTRGSFDLPLELCKMLSAPKFGCALVA